MKQIRFIPSGCQFWFKHVLATGGEYAAYCSSLAIYVLKLPEFRTAKILTAHESNITSITWNTKNPEQFASSGSDGSIFFWNVNRDHHDFEVKLGSQPTQVAYNPHDGNNLLALCENGELLSFSHQSRSFVRIFQLEKLPTVLRFNILAANKVAVGCNDGTVAVIHLQANKIVKLQTKSEDDIPKILDVQWDQVSPNYLLACWEDGAMSLFDADLGTEMQKFEKQTGGISCILWTKEHPGGFITCTDKIPAIKLWNVSNKLPLQTIKVGHTGIMNFVMIPSEVLPTTICCSFKNGSVGFYNYKTRRFSYMTEPGHSETVFDVAFSVTDKNIFATASYDGAIKLWDLRTMTALKTLRTMEMKPFKNMRFKVVYGIAWSPMDNRLVSVNSVGEVVLWDTDKGKILQEIVVGSNPVHRVDWNTQDPSLIASGSHEGTAYIFRADGNKLRVEKKIYHETTVIGVAWNPFQRHILATSCIDGSVRLYDIEGPSEKMIKALNGHTAKVFNLAWNPLVPNVLASGSDDRTIKIWDTVKGTYLSLVGHLSNVRPLRWHSELPWMIISGSWDASIRLWDVRNAMCVQTANEHHADVYGLTIHPARPFVMVSCSRDTTLRLWNIDNFAPLQSGLTRLVFSPGDMALDAMLGEIRGDLGVAQVKENETWTLYGAQSKQLKKRLMERSEKWAKFAEIMQFFSYAEGQEDFWEIVKVNQTKFFGKNVNRNASIVHQNDLAANVKAKALAFESKDSITFDHTLKKKDRLIEAANLYYKIGEFELYCETMVKASCWEKALSVAPSVSAEYWQKLARKYADYLKQGENTEEAGFFYLAAGDVKQAIDQSLHNDEFEDAKLIASLALKGKFQKSRHNETKVANDSQTGKNVEDSLRKINDVLSDRYIKEGKFLLAAACHLAIDDIKRTLASLTKANAYLYAFLVSSIYGEGNEEIIPQLKKQAIEVMKDQQLADLISTASRK